MIAGRWAVLDPRKKRVLVIAAAVAALVAVVTLFSGKAEQEVPRASGETIRHVITDRDTREIGIDALSAEIKMLARDSADLKKTMARVERELQRRGRPSDAETTGLDDELARLRRDLDALKKGDTMAPAPGASAVVADTAATDRSAGDAGPGWVAEDADALFREPPPAAADDHGAAAAGIRIVVRSNADAARDTTAKNDGDDALYLPPGSILTAVLINGMDAPTAQGARRDPFPAVLRVQREAILPNLFSADVRECFLIVSGYGSLSAERAYLRGETLSCVRADGGVMEARLDSYVVGEDGKTGVRGRVVSKQGQVIAKSLAAGFLGGVSKAFDANPVPVLATAPGADALYQSLFSKQMLKGSAAKGMSKALDRIAQFYIDMAEEMFPVVEIDAGRRVDIIVTKGASLQLRSTGRAEK